jgi:tetratricopeptide (TPR) repeat protein
MAIMSPSYHHLQKGDLNSAIPVIDRGLKHCRTHHLHHWIARFCATLGRALALSGNVVDALPLSEEGLMETESLGIVPWHSPIVTWLGETHLLAGQPEDSIPHALRALDLSRSRKELGHEAWALRLLGEIHAHPEALDAEKSEENYRAALALAEELGMRPLQAHCRKGLGTLYGRTGREEVGRSELTAAMDMYRDMGMDFFLNQAEEVMAEVG